LPTLEEPGADWADDQRRPRPTTELTRQKSLQMCGDNLPLFNLRQMAGFLNHFNACVRNQLRKFRGIRWRDPRILRVPRHQRLRFDPAQPALQSALGNRMEK
jgi:hypothetical protein